MQRCGIFPRSCCRACVPPRRRSGARATSAAAKYAATSLFLDVLLSAETAVLLPLLYLYAGTVICGTTLENDVLASLSGLLRKAFRLLLIGFASVFTLYLSLTGILTGSADAAAAKAVKTAVSAALPVVGSIVADAASTVTSSAAILRSGIGVVGVVSRRRHVRHAVFAVRHALCPVQACRRNR
ncbi:MAG: stage III sporulation protein AE [Oscillospiraceae bacterium]